MIRSGYSFKHAIGGLEDVAQRIQEIGWTHQPICDRNSTFGFVRWSKLVPRPIYGVELCVTPNLGNCKRLPDQDWWSFLAIDRLVDVHNLIGIATCPHYRVPILTYDEVIEAKGVIKIAGKAAQLHRLNPQDNNLFVGLTPSLPIRQYREAASAGFRFIASSDNVYTRVDDLELYRIALWRNASTQTYPQHILSDDEWRASVDFAEAKDIANALENRQLVFDRCTAKLETATIFKPERSKTLKQMCVDGARRKHVDLTDDAYGARLDHELKMIAEKDYEDYFYIIADLVAFAKKHMIVGPGRGSSSGSLVCYLLDITTVDPLKFDLIFERFIDVSRNDLPDIDLDFADSKRQLVFDYAENKYGKEHMARLGTTGMFRPRSALNAAGAALRIPRWKIDKVFEHMIVRPSGDSRALQQLEDTLQDTPSGKELLAEYPLAMQSSRLEGQPTHSSQHAAGIVLTAEPIARFVAIDHRTKSTMCDKKDAETLNLLKIDALGLTQLSIFERCLELAGKPFVGFFDDLPLDDPKVFDVFNKHQYAGIFQFNGRALKGLASRVNVDDIEDIIALTALARPGPMASGGANEWLMRKNGVHSVIYPHPVFEPYLKRDRGIVIYQETVLRIGREIGGLSWDAVTKLRQSISKSLGKEHFNQFGDPWKAGAIAKGVPSDVAERVWYELCEYGQYSFNRSHSVAYGLVSYYCAYLKAYYPVQFAAATLDAESLPERQIELLRELDREGIKYRPFDIECSDLRWAINKSGMLVGPLLNVDGIGPKTAQEIIDAREEKRPLRPTLFNRLKNATTKIDSLFPIRDCVAKKWSDLKRIGIFSDITDIGSTEEEATEDKKVTIIGVAIKIATRDVNDPEKVAKRGGRRLTGPVSVLNLHIRDDTGEIFCQVDRFNYERLGRIIAEEGVADKSLYCIHGIVPHDFRMIRISAIRWLGNI